MLSMTGYGKAEAQINGKELIVELKAVNHRFLDVNIKMPRIFNAFEDTMRKIVASKISRGHVDVYVNYFDNSQDEKTVQVDLGLAKGYLTAARELQRNFFLADDFTLSRLMHSPEVLKVAPDEGDEQVLKALVEQAVSAACDNLNVMRSFEGEKLKADLQNRVANVENFVNKIAQKAPLVAKEYAEKLKQRISDALQGVQVDEGKFLNEVAFFVDKANIDEELARLTSHISQFRHIISAEKCEGKKLDFLVQEFNREANTICSKSNNAELTAVALELKNEIEKIREQVQNVE